MDHRENPIAQFPGQAPGRPLFLPDLTLWYSWHAKRGTLPEACRGKSLAGVASALNCPAWTVRAPWRLEHDGIGIVREETGTRRVIRYRTGSGVLSETWVLGPDGDWWQKEYPVKDEDDLDAAEEILKAMRYRPDVAGPAASEPGPGIIDVIQLPKVPYSDMLHTMLGWSDGLMLMMAEEERLAGLLGIMEEKRDGLIRHLASGHGRSIFLAPDNLDGQFISPAAFAKHLQPSYRTAAETLHRHGHFLWVHVGGTSRHLLPLLAGSGIDGLSGISGPPQSDATLAEARAAAGPEVTLWGGIPQDYVMPMHDRSALMRSVEEARAFARSDGRTIVGVADHVPVDAEFDRLREIADRMSRS